MVFDHLGINFSDFDTAKAFFEKALHPLEMAVTETGDGWVMIGRRGEGELWIGSFAASPGPIHVAFSATSREQVRQFYAAALAAGGKDNGAPGLRPNYHPNYYGAFVIGPDGHNIEAVCHKAEAN